MMTIGEEYNVIVYDVICLCGIDKGVVRKRVRAVIEHHYENKHNDADNRDGGNRDCTECQAKHHSHKAEFVLRRAEFERPAGVGVPRKENRIIVFSVIGKKLCVGVVRHFVLKAPVETSVILKHAHHKPNPRTNHVHRAYEVHCKSGVSGQTCKYRCKHGEHATDYACPTCIRQSADRRVRREHEALGDGIESQLFELVRHIVVILLLVVRAGKTRAYLARGILYHS